MIDATRTLTDRAMLMVLYSTAMRNAEMRSLQVLNIDSRSMLIHTERGKGGRDRYVPLSATLLETLRAYWCSVSIPRERCDTAYVLAVIFNAGKVVNCDGVRLCVKLRWPG